MSAEPNKESFRDSIATVDEKGHRIWVYPKKPKGKFTNYRTIVSIFLLTILFSGPFYRINGEPLLMLDILERKFVIFGNIFWPQDFHLFVFAMIAAIVFVILFTVVFGRLFCGWVCPQTIFMEMVFRKVEYLIEGDYKQQMKLDKQDWNGEKIWKKSLKHLIFLIISFIIGNTFLAYLIGSEELFKIMTEPVTKHVGGFTAMIVFSVAFYGVFAKLREQVCTTICPYGRLQGVLLDRNSLVVAYDYHRGERKEGRAKFKKNEDREAIGKGDCIDCGQCVYVCPTGIDIRNGTQLECVNCTACMDACDHMMESVHLKAGLIGYKSEESIANGIKFHMTTRIIGYIAVLTVLVMIFIALLLGRTDVETSILRTPGVMYQTQEDGRISNLYNYKVINKTNLDFPVAFKLEEIEGDVQMIGTMDTVHSQAVLEGAMFIILERQALEGIKTHLKIGIYNADKKLETAKTNFMGPVK
ncbi:MAG: cytochrome c oxidase accessory protein CcoG [Flavobacteriales bacterium]|nr:cytochrome c oxidase accessory protein CcoG [Flavobacteriales bacterium]